MSMLNKFVLILMVCCVTLFAQQSVFSQSQPGGFDQNWNNYPAGEFGSMPITFDYTGVRSIEQAPAVGIHPRIFFGPSEIPAMQTRLATTTSGQEVMAQIHAYTTLQHLSYNPGGYNHNSSYGADAFGNKRIDNAGKWNSHEIYYKLIAQDPNALIDPSTGNLADNKRRYLLASCMALEAFECLMKAGQTDPDTGLDYNTRAADLGTAMAHWASLVLGDPNLNSNNYHYFGGPHMAMCYDLNYNSMTTAQQDLVRDALAAIVPANPRYGATTEPYATTSNWCGLNSFEIIGDLAIEGEQGYNQSLIEDFMRAYRNFITYGWYESGTPYEGMGKNYQFVGTLVAMAKRGYSLLGHPHVRAYGNDFLPAITQPYGHAFIGTDVWGGTGWDEETGGYKSNACDVVGLKWAFPNDSNIDFVWRNYIEKWYKLNNASGYVYQQIEPATSGYFNYLLLAGIFSDDYQTGDWTTQNTNTLQDLSFLAPERGLATIRSDFDPDAMMVHYHIRQDLGGHTHGDRNSFTLSSHGRIWTPYTYGGAFQETEYHSCILIDDLGIKITEKDGRKARQAGTLLDFQENTDHAFIAGDATYAYSWEYHWETRSAAQDHAWLGTNNWVEELSTWNDFRNQPGPYAYHNLPYYDYGNWNSGGNLERIIKRPFNPMQKVYRGLSMMRGNYPFVLIVDDVQKDNAVHNYKWLEQMALDLSIESTDVNLVDCDYRCDVIMKEPTGNRKLLVRFLNMDGYTGGPPAYLDTIVHSGMTKQRLIAEVNTISPDFKVLLYPYVDGDPMPLTVWNATHDSLIVSIDTESKMITFPVNNGRTEIVYDNTLNPDIDSDGVVNFCDVCPLDILDDSDLDGVCDTYDICQGADDNIDTNSNSLPDGCEAVEVDLRVMLEGAFNVNTGQMHTSLNDLNLIPLSQPYNIAPYNYAGSETVTSFPADMVDWVMVEVRSGPTSASLIERQAGILLKDGFIRGTDGTSLLSFDLPVGGDYYFVVRHRNHLDVMTQQDFPRSLTLTFDFTAAITNAYGNLQQKMLPNGLSAMWAGDISQDLSIQTLDYDVWKVTPAVLNIYDAADLNLDGIIQTTDFDQWYINQAKLTPPELGY